MITRLLRYIMYCDGAAMLEVGCPTAKTPTRCRQNPFTSVGQNFNIGSGRKRAFSQRGCRRIRYPRRPPISVINRLSKETGPVRCFRLRGPQKYFFDSEKKIACKRKDRRLSFRLLKIRAAAVRSVPIRAAAIEKYPNLKADCNKKRRLETVEINL